MSNTTTADFRLERETEKWTVADRLTYIKKSFEAVMIVQKTYGGVVTKSWAARALGVSNTRITELLANGQLDRAIVRDCLGEVDLDGVGLRSIKERLKSKPKTGRPVGWRKNKT